MGKSKYTEMQVYRAVENKLQQSGVDYQTSVIANGSSADFFFSTPTIGSVIFEVKNWEPTTENIDRAKIISNSIKSSSDVDHAFVIFPETTDQNLIAKGILSVNQIEEIVKSSELHLNPKFINMPVIRQPNPSYKAFIAMPFAPNFEDTYFQAIQPACNEVDVDCIRIDQSEYSGDIKNKICNEISTSDIIIADVTNSNPNVTYEIGFAESKGLPKIQLCVKSKEKMPFDIDHDKTIFYEFGLTHALKEPIIQHLKSLLKII